MSVVYGRPLSELGEVDWAKLKHAYGSAEDVPEQLRRLAVGDEDALSDLYGNLWHQGTVYQATAHAVPFILGLLESGQSELIHWLECVAQGASYYDVHQIYDDPKEVASKSYQARLTRELRWVRKVRAAVLVGWPVYQRFLGDADAEIRGVTATLLGVLSPDQPQALPALRPLLDDPEPVVRAAAASALWTVSVQPEFLPRLTAMLGDADPLPTLMAAVTLALWQGREAGDAVTERLRQAVLDPDLEDSLMRLPSQSSDLTPIDAAVKALGQPGLFALVYLDRYQLTEDSDALHSALVIASRMTGDEQGQVLVPVLDAVLALSERELNASRRLLELLGWPTDRSGLTAFLKELRP